MHQSIYLQPKPHELDRCNASGGVSAPNSERLAQSDVRQLHNVTMSFDAKYTFAYRQLVYLHTLDHAKVT